MTYAPDRPSIRHARGTKNFLRELSGRPRIRCIPSDEGLPSSHGEAIRRNIEASDCRRSAGYALGCGSAATEAIRATPEPAAAASQLERPLERGDRPSARRLAV